MILFSDEDMLPLSGIQHYRFCPRQWALIHMYQEWEENRLTFEGHLLHQNVDNPFYRQKQGKNISIHSVNVASKTLGLYGVMDIVELHPTVSPDNAITHPSYPGLWIPVPIEYKHGKPKDNYIDEVQLAAQTICLEEMYGIRIEKGAIFYERTRHRSEVMITDELRDVVDTCCKEMHEKYKSQTLPSPAHSKQCKNCSLIDICNPQLSSLPDPEAYLKAQLYEETS